ncbi:hypothetical protein ACTXT7_007216 [Hymenolepis weldensis]
MLYLVSPACFCLLTCANAYPWMPTDEEPHRHHEHYDFGHSDWMSQEKAFDEEYDNGKEKPFHYKENEFEGCHPEVNIITVMSSMIAVTAIKAPTNDTLPEYVNLFLYEKSGFVEYIINSHKNLPELPANTKTETLEYVIKNMPSVNEKPSKIESECLLGILDDLSEIPVCLADLETSVLVATVTNLPLLDRFVPKPGN